MKGLKGLKKAGWLAAALMIILGIYAIALPQFNPSEAEEAHGRTYDLKSGWLLTYPDGRQEEVELPFKTRRLQGDKVILENSIPTEYEGLALRFVVQNATVRVFIDGLPLFTGGMPGGPGAGPGPQPGGPPDMFAGGTGGVGLMFQGSTAAQGNEPPVNWSVSGQQGNLQQENGFQEMTAPAAGGDLGGTGASDNGVDVPEGEYTGEQEQSGSEENIIDLPDSMERGNIVVELEAVRPGSSIFIREAGISKRDVAVISQLRGSFPKIVLCILILMCVAVLLGMEVISRIFGWRRHSLLSFACFGLVSIVYCVSGTLILTAFFGNELFFSTLESLMYIIMPLLFATSHGGSYAGSFKKGVLVLNLAGVMAAIVQLFSCFIGAVALKDTEYVSTFCFTVFIIACMLMERFQGRQQERGKSSPIIYAAYLSLLLAMLIRWTGIFLTVNSDFGVFRTILITLYFIFIVFHFGAALFNEYREGVEESKRKLVAANEAKSQFLARMSHEIRTPINAVLGMDEMILRESGEERIREYAGDINTAGHALLSIINDILDLSKIDSGKMEIVPVEYDLCSVINDLVNMIAMRARDKGLTLNTRVDESLPARLVGDDVRIKQVLTNILTNAVKYTHEGSVTLRISGTREGDRDLILSCEVEDTGIGIKSEDMSKLFSAFDRIEESRNRNIEGTGLGMNITLQLLKLMDSELKVESVYGEGSKFYFKLRQGIADPSPIGDFDERVRSAAKSISYSSTFTAPGAKVLVVDDNATNRKVFKSLLKSTLIQIDEAEGGQECLGLVAKSHYDLIFLDHMMPKPDGIETLHLMKGLPENKCKDTPVIVLTANAIAGARENYIKEGFDSFLSKPIMPDRLEQLIREMLPEELLQEGLPEDSLHNSYAPENASFDAAFSPDTEELPDIDGLDWNYAFLHLPERELMLETLKDFYDLMDLHGEKLQGFYSLLPDGEALNSYRIQVHGMKSAATSVGIVTLGGMARVLESAAGSGRVDIINSLHPVFMEEWSAFKAKLDGIFKEAGAEGTKGEEVDISITLALLELISSAARDMDMDAMDERVGELLKYEYSEDVAGNIGRLKSAAADLDFDGVEELAQKLKTRLEQD